MAGAHAPAEAGGDTGRTLLRVLTCGSVDDGKSTLIGRLLFDSHLIPDDQFAALERDSKRVGTRGGEIDFALLLDGLDAERQQGITIDVAYRYFRTDNRAFIIADTPGHVQYTRNMVTGASTADVAIILVDARKGILPQTRRHSRLCALMGVKHVVLAVNKLDLAGFSQEVFAAVERDYRVFAAALDFRSIAAIPLSAVGGDNVVDPSANTPWYAGPSLIAYLDGLDTAVDLSGRPFRFPVQWVSRPNLDFRGFAGTIASGTIRAGDRVTIASSQVATTVARIVTFDGDRPQAEAGEAVVLTLGEEVDLSRGDVLTRADEGAPPATVDQFAAHLVWMGAEPLLPGRSYLIRMETQEVPATVSSLRYKLDTTTHEHLAARSLELNEIGFCHLSMAAPLTFDSYAESRETAAFIVIDRATNDTVGAGMIAHPLRRAENLHAQAVTLDKAIRAGLKRQKPAILWFTGLSGAGKSTIANLVEQALHRRGVHTYLLDGDNIRLGINRDLGFTAADRVENIRRVGEIARLFIDAGLVVLCSFISPFEAERSMVRKLVGEGEFIEIFVDAPLALCQERDPKGLYRKAAAGQIQNFTGITSPYEAPANPEIVLRTGNETAPDLAELVVRWMEDHRMFA